MQLPASDQLRFPADVNRYLAKHAGLSDFFKSQSDDLASLAFARAQPPAFLGVNDQGCCFVTVRGLRLMCARAALSLSSSQLEAVNAAIRGVTVSDYREFHNLLRFLETDARTAVVELLIDAAIHATGHRDGHAEFFSSGSRSAGVSLALPVVFSAATGECVLHLVLPAKADALNALEALKAKLVKGKLCATMPADKTRLVFAGTNTVASVAEACKDEKFLVIGTDTSLTRPNVAVQEKTLEYSNHSELANSLDESLVVKCSREFPSNFAKHIISDRHIVLLDAGKYQALLPFWLN